MKLRELFTEAPIGQAIGQAVGKAAANVGSAAGKVVGKAAQANDSIKSVGSAFNQGRSDAASGKISRFTSEKSSPFDIIPTRDAKGILQNVIAGKPLDGNQIAMLKKVYSKL